MTQRKREEPGDKNSLADAFVADARVRIGHVHLKVADLRRALEFYCGVLGFTLMQRFGDGAAFIAAGGYHHHIGLNTWESLGGSPPAPGTTGLYHTAIVYPTRGELAKALHRVLAAKIPLDGAADHGVSESIYLRDPDENGVGCIATSRKKRGRTTRMETWRCIRGRWICGRCLRKCRRIGKFRQGRGICSSCKSASVVGGFLVRETNKTSGVLRKSVLRKELGGRSWQECGSAEDRPETRLGVDVRE